MALSSRFDPRTSRKVVGVAASAALHVALLLLIMLGGNRYGIDSGDSPTSKLLLLEAPDAEQREGVDLPPLPAGSTAPSDVELEEALARLAPPASEATEDQAVEPGPIEAVEAPAPSQIALVAGEIPSPTVTMSSSERASLSRRLEQLAEQALKSSRNEVTWEQDGRQYSALLIRERANEGTALERVIAQVSASDHGKQLTTLVNLARSFNTESIGRRRESEIFRGGFETGTSEIELPESSQPFEWAPRDELARVHEFGSDTRIRFFADGSYRWTDLNTMQSKYLNEPAEHPVYFIGKGKAALRVQGVLAGKVLLYSPRLIVIEGDLTYATDPRIDSDSDDYLGIVSDRVVEVAPPHVTGGGDLEIDAAIYAGRRFVVTGIDHARTATLRIYGSLAAGTISATEPRYATKIDYDTRFERQRPPGFPSTNRYEVANWNGQWTQR